MNTHMLSPCFRIWSLSLSPYDSSYALRGIVSRMVLMVSWKCSKLGVQVYYLENLLVLVAWNLMETMVLKQLVVEFSEGGREIFYLVSPLTLVCSLLFFYRRYEQYYGGLALDNFSWRYSLSIVEDSRQWRSSLILLQPFISLWTYVMSDKRVITWFSARNVLHSLNFAVVKHVRQEANQAVDASAKYGFSITKSRINFKFFPLLPRMPYWQI